MDFGRYLEEVVIKSGLSLRELSKRSGVSHSYLSLVKNGKRGVPTPEQLKKLAPHLNVDYMELMKAAGYVTPDMDFTEEEVAFLKSIDEGAPLIELLKQKPTIDNREVTQDELELAINIIRNLRQSQQKKGE